LDIYLIIFNLKEVVGGGEAPRPNYGKLKPTGLKNRVGGLIDFEFLDKATKNYFVQKRNKNNFLKFSLSGGLLGAKPFYFSKIKEI